MSPIRIRTLPRLLAAASLLLFLPLLGLAGCGDGDRREPSVDARGPAGLEVTHMQLGSQLRGDKRVAEEKSSFRPNDTIYLSVGTEGRKEGKLEVVWEYENGQVIDRTSRRISPQGDATTEFHVSKPDGWPEGDYQVTLLVDGRKVESRDFEVERN